MHKMRLEKIERESEKSEKGREEENDVSVMFNCTYQATSFIIDAIEISRERKNKTNLMLNFRSHWFDTFLYS